MVIFYFLIQSELTPLIGRCTAEREVASLIPRARPILGVLI